MLLPDPHEVRATFSDLMAKDPEKAVAYLHELGVSSGYIDVKAIARNVRWVSKSLGVDIECTINLSKPEKDPLEIAAAASDVACGVDDVAVLSGVQVHRLTQHVPQCDLCWENEGFPGTPEHPAKPGLRIVPITLGGECWGLQYSPYAYFNEHCIALSKEHRPMRIDESCFERLIDFVDVFPFYFIGANADLPIVGASILSHDHFQGGRHEFPLMRAPITRNVHLKGLPELQCGIVDWPASVLRLTSKDRAALSKAASRILNVWRGYSNESCDIVASSEAQHVGSIQHNTLNFIVYKKESAYIMDLVLRNNRTDAQHPWGIFHPPESMHHIKKENIGLIEIMGMAILPPRLVNELPLVQQELMDAARRNLSLAELEARLKSQEMIAPHAAWATDVYDRRAAELRETVAQQPGYPKAPFDVNNNGLHPVIQQEVASVFVSILKTTGVFKRNAIGAAGWNSFIDRIA